MMLRPIGSLLCAFVLLMSAAALAEPSGGMGIPVVAIEGENLSDWGDKKDVRSATLKYLDEANDVSFCREIRMKPQGTSSLGYEKKNFTIDMQGEGVVMKPAWGVQTEYCLKANYIDPTQACNVVSARLAGEMNRALGLFADAPNAGAIDGFPVWITLNGQDAGLYTWNIPKSAWMFGMDEANENHLVLCAEGWTDGCLFMTDKYQPDEEWSVEVGPDTPQTAEKFTRLLRFVAKSDDDTFKAEFAQYLNLDACLNYCCFVCVADAEDNCGKNMLMTTRDGQVWAPALYDLDSLWGISYDGLSLMRELTGSETANPFENRLFERIRDCFPEELNARYAFLRTGVLSTAHIREMFLSFCGAIPTECFRQDQQMWNADGLMIRTCELMFSQMDDYLPLVDAAFGLSGPATRCDIK